MDDVKLTCYSSRRSSNSSSTYRRQSISR